MPNPGPEPRFHIETHGTADSVRQILIDLRAFVEGLWPDADTSGTIEIVMAEALNNIIEHAYTPGCEGPLWLSAQRDGGLLRVELRDTGRPLSGCKLPQTDLPDASGPLQGLPEGGFGWFLIRDLTDSLSYRRFGAQNRLTLEFWLNRAVQP